jgi:site-specific recombinase XerD
MPNLTKRQADAALPRSKDYFLWCQRTPGFGLRVYPSGKKVFVAQVRVGRQLRRVKIGAFGPFTVEQARTQAEGIVRSASEGRDPQREKRAVRDAVTVGELCDLYLKAASAGLVTTRFGRPKRSSTIAIDEGRVTRHIKPTIGRLPARELSRSDVQRMIDAIAEGKTAGSFQGAKPRGKAVVKGGCGTAARVAELLGGIYTWAEKRGYVDGPNPVRGVDKARAGAKDRTLSTEELQELGKALRKSAPSWPMAAQVVRLIALTALRRQEACALRWTEVDWTGHCLRLDGTKTGKSVRPIGKSAIRLLRSIDRLSDKWVFPNRDGSGGADLKKTMASLFDGAGLSDVRSHDLRRTFASVAADEGYGDATIGELLGHARRGVTSRYYIRRPDGALVAAADRTAGRIAEALDVEHQD